MERKETSEEPDPAAAERRARHETIYEEWGLPRFVHWPVAERVLAGRNPLSEEDVLQLGALGVTHVLDLREEREWADPGRFGREAVEALYRDGIERRSVPIRDGS